MFVIFNWNVKVDFVMGDFDFSDPGFFLLIAGSLVE
jgi:hypothetical protein